MKYDQIAKWIWFLSLKEKKKKKKKKNFSLQWLHLPDENIIHRHSKLI